ncbi:protein of unknown function [Burkholderia multivorans]
MRRASDDPPRVQQLRFLLRPRRRRKGLQEGGRARRQHVGDVALYRRHRQRSGRRARLRAAGRHAVHGDGPVHARAIHRVPRRRAAGRLARGDGRRRAARGRLRASALRIHLVAVQGRVRTAV